MSFRPATLFRTCRRFAVPPVPEDFRDRFAAALAENGFRPPLTELNKEERIGWVDATKPLRSDFADVNAWLFNQYATFALRVDQKKVQPARLAALVEERAEAWCREMRRERCPSKVKAEIKEQAEAELLAKTTPKMQTYGVVWNVAENWLVIACTSTTRLDTFRKLFHRTFGLTITPADPLDLVPTEIGCALLDTGALDLTPAPGVEVPAMEVDALPDGEMGPLEESCPPHVAGDFLLWLWYRSRSERGRLDLGEGSAVEWWIDGRIDFRSPGEEKTTYSVGGDDPSASAVALAALAHGALVKAVGLTIRREDREYTLRIGDAMLHRSASKMPAMVKGGDVAEQLYEAAFLYEEREYLLRHIFATWANQRVHQGRQGEAAIRRWLGLELAQRFEVDAYGQGMLFARVVA